MNNNYIKVSIQGKNVNNYIKWLISKKINIIDLKIIKHNELELLVNYQDYPLLSKYSKTYKVIIKKKYGLIRLVDILRNNIIIISCLILSIVFLYFLSNIIFSVDIIYNDQMVVDNLTKELIKYNIKPFKKKKSYDYLEKVKKQILNDNKDTLEWLEFEEVGTKYIVRLVERKKESLPKEYQYQSVVAKKDATITSLIAYSGEKIKLKNEYVKKGETIISGILTKPDGTNLYTKAKGYVEGEVWYKVDVEYPLYYQEELVTGKSKNVLAIYFLNKEIPLFPYQKYKQFKRQRHILLESFLLPVYIVKERLYEVNIIEDIYMEEEATEKAILEVEKKMTKNNRSILTIKDIKILNKQNLNSKIKLKLFISTIEDITAVKEEIFENN